MTLKLGINARFLREYTLRGLNRYTFCLLKELQKRSDIEIHLYSELKSPIHPSFQSQLQAPMHLLAAPKTLLWEQVVLPSALKKDGIEIFQGNLVLFIRLGLIITFLGF